MIFTPDQILDFITRGGVPAIMFLMWYLEWRERRRLQKVVEGFLPLVAGTRRMLARIDQATAVVDGDSGVG